MIQTVPVSKPTSEDLPITIGIDVSKEYLDAARYPSGETIRVANTQKDHAVLLRWINRKSKINRVIFEATGPYHKGFERRLITAGIPFAKINPRQARRFAEATGKFAKTDRVDALMLARFGALLEPAIRPARTETQNQLTELVGARRSLMGDRTATLNRLQTLTMTLLKRHAQHRCRQIEARVASLDAAIAEVLAADPILSRKRDVLLSIPGLGVVTVQALLADMPELGTMDEAQAASLAGLVPITCQSGKWEGKSSIRGGRATAMYGSWLYCSKNNHSCTRVRSRPGSGSHSVPSPKCRRMALLSVSMVPSSKTSVGTLPIGLSAKNTGVWVSPAFPSVCTHSNA